MMNNGLIEVSYITLIVSVIGILSGLLIILQFSRQKYESKLNSLQDEALLKLKALNEKIELNHSSYEGQINTLNTSNRKLEEEKKLIKESLEDKLRTLEKHTDETLDNITANYELKLSSQEKMSKTKEENLNERIALLEESKVQMKVEFENLANKLFDENQKKSNLNLTQVLTSFKDQLESFGKRANDIYSEETKQRTSLLTEIKTLKDLNNQISADAINLTKALKGENKTQGDWGEMILSSILDQTGLREGKEYDTQGSYTDKDGKVLRPDVIVHLPSQKDIIIDSKVSLNSYLSHTKTDDKAKKEIAAKELIKSITSHIKGLSSKKYEDIEGVKTLDFVLMFVPIEGAFLLASNEDKNLFKMAFDHNIMIVSPSTLFVTLRTIENIWRNEHQNENAEIIAKKAADLYDKFYGFIKDIEEIGLNINKTQKAYNSAFSKLSTGNGNLMKRSEEFLELGVKPKKQINTKNISME
ncbi:DNA recombination protein RmuC [Poseidonibacter lekithochrous]|uniref:DNA recombination protein RmuC n=1 Tax=Poseidonibacter TaxID=2321187 RepID=UPI001C0A4C8A|nr:MULTISPECIES: DNA recombination protein RmuC [Poseidonibacter]MBU3014786.1 DNA recombination protein RmuC [Poseidonibacter lekithochrous]MDO6828084.1 DNA recombination protein RmuC [Poseidonibacter sp. 1_MG-2023]